jgi:hypothetical protein
MLDGLKHQTQTPNIKDHNDKKIQTTKRFKRQKDSNDKKITTTKRSQLQKDHKDKKIQTTKRSQRQKDHTINLLTIGCTRHHDFVGFGVGAIHRQHRP